MLLLLAACPVDTPKSPENYDEYFAFDGTRVATFLNGDATLTHEKIALSELADEREIFTFEYWLDGTLQGSTRWSNLHGDVRVHGWSGADGVEVDLDPPLQVVEEAQSDTTVTTETGGVTWTSTIVGRETCAVLWGDEEWDCLHLRIEPDTDALFAGDHWLVPRYWIAWMDIPGSDGTWVLSDFEDGS